MTLAVCLAAPCGTARSVAADSAHNVDRAAPRAAIADPLVLPAGSLEVVGAFSLLISENGGPYAFAGIAGASYGVLDRVELGMGADLGYHDGSLSHHSLWMTAGVALATTTKVQAAGRLTGHVIWAEDFRGLRLQVDAPVRIALTKRGALLLGQRLVSLYEGAGGHLNLHVSLLYALKPIVAVEATFTPTHIRLYGDAGETELLTDGFLRAGLVFPWSSSMESWVVIAADPGAWVYVGGIAWRP